MGRPCVFEGETDDVGPVMSGGDSLAAWEPAEGVVQAGLAGKSASLGNVLEREPSEGATAKAEDDVDVDKPGVVKPGGEFAKEDDIVPGGRLLAGV